MDFKEISKNFKAGVNDLGLNSQKKGPIKSGENKESTKSSKIRRGKGGAKKTTSAETKEKQRESSRASKEKTEIKNYIDKILLGINFEPEILNLAQKIIGEMNELAAKSVEVLDIENKKEEALRMISEEVANKLQTLDKNSKEYKVYSKINEVVGASKRKRVRLEEINKELQSEENELSNAERLLNSASKESVKDKLNDRILRHGEKIERLKFDRDSLEGEELDSIEDLIGKNGKIKKVMKKNGKATVVDSGEIFNVRLASNPKKGETILFDPVNGGIKNTSRVLNIKRCLDGSYIIETNTSYYRLEIDEDKNVKNEEEFKFNKKEKSQAENLDNNVETALDPEDEKAAQEKLDENIITAENEQTTANDPIERLRGMGADEDDINNFFNLEKKDREALLNLDDDKIKEKLGELKAERIEADILEGENTLIEIGNQMREKRKAYLQKKVEIERLTNRLSRFFGKDKKIKYEAIEEELEFLRKEYREAMDDYSQSFAQMQGYYDKEDFDIILRYLNFSERLNLINEELDIKTQETPDVLEKMKGVFEKVGSEYLGAYKKTSTFLSQKATEMVSRHTDSKIFKMVGGLGGAMAFGVGLSNIIKATNAPYWAAKAVLLATSTAVITVDNKEKMDQEFELKEREAALDRFNEAWNEINAALDAKLDKVIEDTLVKSANVSLDNGEAEREKNRNRWKEAFMKAAGKNLFFFSAGYGVAEMMRDFAEYFYDSADTPHVNEDLLEKDNLTEPNVAEQQANDSAKVEEVLNDPRVQVNGTGVHSGPVVPVVTKEGDIVMDIDKSSTPVENNITELGNVEIKEDLRQDDFRGIELDDSKQGEIAVIAKTGIKDSLAKFLTENHDKLTEGKMGWNPEKYESIEDWANKRAIGIVGELKSQYPNYNFDKVSTESKFIVDLSNKSDIRIIGFDDNQSLGGNPEEIKYLSENKINIDERETLRNETTKNSQLKSAEDMVTLEDEAKQFREEIISELKKQNPEFDVDKSIEEIRNELRLEESNRMATQKEFDLVQKLGFTPEEYSELNNITITELEELKDSPNSNSANVQLKRVFNYLDGRDGVVLDKNQTVGEAIREIDSSVIEDIFDKNNEVLTQNFEPVIERLSAEEFYANFIKTELPELMRDKTRLGEIFRNINSIGKESVGSQPENGVFNSFRQVFNKSVGDFGYNNDGNIRMYVLKAMRKAYEIGKMDEFKEALRSN